MLPSNQMCPVENNIFTSVVVHSALTSVRLHLPDSLMTKLLSSKYIAVHANWEVPVFYSIHIPQFGSFQESSHTIHSNSVASIHPFLDTENISYSSQYTYINTVQKNCKFLSKLSTRRKRIINNDILGMYQHNHNRSTRSQLLMQMHNRLISTFSLLRHSSYFTDEFMQTSYSTAHLL